MKAKAKRKGTKKHTKVPGSFASRKEFFGEHDRYAVYSVHNRFGGIEWMVADAEKTDPLTGFADIIRQAPTKEEAIAGLA